MKQFVTENLFIVIMVAVVLIALIAIIYPVTQISAANEYARQLQEKDNQLTSAIGQASRGTISPDWNYESKLGLDRIKDIQEQVIEQALLHSTRHRKKPAESQPDLRPLLVNDKLIFPDPNLVTGSRMDFPLYYTDGLDGLLKLMGAEGLPTEKEVNDQKLKEQARIEARPGVKAPANLLETVRASMIRQRAERGGVWATLNSFDDAMKAPGVMPGRTPMSDQQLWDSLVNFWIQKDIAEVIAEFNRKPLPGGGIPRNVKEAPIKELVSIKIKRGYYPQQQTSGSSGGAARNEISLTGRVTNARYHVVLYTLRIVMDPSRFNELMGALQVKNFHTVHSYKQETLDHRGELGAAQPAPAVVSGGGATGPARYDYGSGSVSLYTLECEAIFMNSPKSWRGKNEQEGREKRLAFLRRADNRKLVLEVHAIRANNARAVVLPVATIRSQPSRLDELLAPGNAFLLLKDWNGRKAGEAVVLSPAQAGGAPAGTLEPTNLQFIFLYEDLMPKDVKDRDPRLYQ